MKLYQYKMLFLYVNGSHIEEVIIRYVLDDLYSANMERDSGHPEPGKLWGKSE